MLLNTNLPFNFGEGTWNLNNTGIYLKLMKSWSLKYGMLLAREPERDTVVREKEKKKFFVLKFSRAKVETCA